MIQITRAEAVALSVSINALGGRHVEVMENDKKVIIVKPYDLTGNARYALAKNKRALTAIMRSIDEERADLNLKRSVPVDAIDRTAATTAAEKIEDINIEREFRKFLHTPVDFDAYKFNIEGLKVQENQLDPAIIEGLLPVLDGTL
jgi:hypothetical protein